MTKEEWFDLPKLNMFDKDFKEKELDEEMTLGLLNELQVNWCGGHCDNYKKNSCGCYFPEFKEQMILKIKDHFESKEDTLEFKNFKLYKNNTLKSMSKDELINYIHVLHHNWSVSNEQLFNVIKIYNKLQDELDVIKNLQPYKFEELKKGMWVWDDKGLYCFECNPAISKNGTRCVTYNAFWYNCGEDEDEFFEEYDEFEEGRFFPVIKAMEYQE